MSTKTFPRPYGSPCKITAFVGSLSCIPYVADVLCVSPAWLHPHLSSRLPARQVLLFCSFCVLPVFKDSSRRARKETNSSDFVTRLVLFPRRGRRETRTSYVRAEGQGRILTGLVVKIFTPKMVRGLFRGLQLNLWIHHESERCFH